MIETVVNLHVHDHWLKRKLRDADANAQTRAVLDVLQAKGIVGRFDTNMDRDSAINDAAMSVLTKVDESLRVSATLRLAEYRPELGLRSSPKA